MSKDNTNPNDIVYQFAVGPAGWYAARASGLYRSEDGGAAWIMAYESLGAAEPLATLAIATAEGPGSSPLVFAGLSGGLLRSQDGGATWAIASIPAPAPIFTALAPSPDFTRDGLLFAGTMEDGVLIYQEHGRDWASWNFGLLDTNVLCLAISPAYAEDHTLFAGVQSGLMRSTNGGRSWHEIDLPGGYTAVLSLALSPTYAADGLIYAGTEDQGLLRSHDGGRSWEPVAPGTWSQPVNSIVLGAGDSGAASLLALHGGTLLHSADGGAHWAGWRAERLAGAEVTTVLAPAGLASGAPVLVGLAGGGIMIV
jgi:photosystem II stability/assembly factor-like uncharacterized protein